MRRPSERTAFADISTLATGLLWGDGVDQQPWICPQCARALSPEDTLLFGRGLLSHLDCRRPRVLSAEERALLFTYCRDHHVAECVRCAGKFHLREIASRDSFGILTHGCPWCHTDLTDSIRAHLYDCAMLPAAVRSRAQTAREAAQSLVKRSHQLSDAADVLLRAAEAALYALRATMRQAPISSATRETKPPGRQIRLLSQHVLPRHLQVGDRFSDETGEWEVASRPYSTADGKVNASIRRVDQPATGADRTWVAHERIRVRRLSGNLETRSV
jgi:hypothetical protein